MRRDRLVEKVVDELVMGLPEKVPRLMSVSGGKDYIRNAIAEKLHERTGSRIKESSNGVYSISLQFFIKKYNPTLC